MKPKILLVVDTKGWAFDNIAKEIKKNLSNYNIVKILILGKKYDLVHFFWRGEISWIYGEYSKWYIERIGFSYEQFVEDFLKGTNITTSVYDHMLLEKNNLKETEFIIQNVKGYTVSSKKLYDIYTKIKDIKKPNLVVQDGVDLELFKPFNKDRFENIKNKEIRIGWVGNSKFTDSENDDDLKGLRKIIIPTLSELKDEGYNIIEYFADRNDKMIPHEEMPNYYNEIDLYICASKTEGTPNPVLEAMACGIPIISTDVGIVPEVFGKKQKEFILKERSKECLKSKIIELLNNRELFDELSKENLNQIKKWSWKEISMKFKKFFDENLK